MVYLHARDIAWDTQEMDSDNARATTVTEAKVIPKDMRSTRPNMC